MNHKQNRFNEPAPKIYIPNLGESNPFKTGLDPNIYTKLLNIAIPGSAITLSREERNTRLFTMSPYINFFAKMLSNEEFRAICDLSIDLDIYDHSNSYVSLDLGAKEARVKLLLSSTEVENPFIDSATLLELLTSATQLREISKLKDGGIKIGILDTEGREYKYDSLEYFISPQTVLDTLMITGYGYSQKA